MCTFNCCVGESLQIGDHVRLEICEAERGHVLIALEWPAGRKKTMVEIISPRDQEDYQESGIVRESAVGKAASRRSFSLVTGSGGDDSKSSIGTRAALVTEPSPDP